MSIRLLILNLQENQYRCCELRCGLKYNIGYGFESLIHHLNVEHGQNVSLDDESQFVSWREFDFPLVLSGKGHKEKNMMQVLFSFNWPVLLEHCAEAISFNTPKQKNLLMMVKDHHKAMDFLQILTDAVDDEIAYYVIKEIKFKNGAGDIPEDVAVISNNLLSKWAEKNENLAYLIILRRFMKSILMHCIGMRLNRNDLINTGEDYFSQLWFLNCNLPYTTIYCADLYQRRCLSQEVREDIEKSECIVKTEDKITTGQSFDFVFEEKNKELKSCLPPNPNFDDFRVATLVKDTSSVIISKVRQRYTTLEETSTAGFPNIDGCVQSVRKVFRSFVGDPTKPKPFKKLSGEDLNSDLVKQFGQECQRRRSIFFEEIKTFGKFTKAPHSEKKFQLLKEAESFEVRAKKLMDSINGGEDSYLNCDYLTRLGEISILADLKKKDKLLEELIEEVNYNDG